MAQAKSKSDERARGGRGVRTGLLAGLLALVAALAVWLSDCVPGFGIGGGGSGEGEGTPAEKAEKAEKTEKTEATPTPEPKPAAEDSVARIEVDVAGCALEDEAAIPCADLCKRIAADELDGKTKVIIAATHGSQADVTTLLDCVNAKKLPVALQRD